MSQLALVTISARIPKHLKRKLDRYKVQVSRVVRTALEEEVLRIQETNLQRQLNETSSKLRGRITERDVVEAVRWTREER